MFGPKRRRQGQLRRSEEGPAESVLSVGAEHYRSVVTAMAEGVVVQDAKGVILACNPRAERILGLTAEQMQGRTSVDSRWRAIHEDGSPFPGEGHPAMVTLRTGEPQENVCMGVEKPDGTLSWILINSEPIFHGGRRTADAVVTTFTDITERKRAEEEIRKSNARLELQIDRMPIGCITWSREFRVTSWNPAAERIFGYTAREAMGRHPYDFIVPSDTKGQVDAIFSRLLRGDASAHSTNENLTQDGRLITCQWTNIPLRERNGAVVGVLSMVDDITERKSAEEEIRRLNADLEQRVLARTAELQAATVELERAREREFEIGYRIQQTLLFDPPPTDVPGLCVAALSIPTQRIDGDFYVFIKHREGDLDVIVGDVMGKGIPAALLGAATKAHFLKALSRLMALSTTGRLPEPREIVMLVHAQMVHQLIDLESFVTLCYARLNIKKHRLDLVDCGHTGIVQLHGETGLSEVLRGDNLPLGVREGEIYEQVSVPCNPGDLLLFFSDGITEARNAAGETFGVARLRECVRSHRQLSPGALVEGIRDAVFDFTQPVGPVDDLTSVAIRMEAIELPLAEAKIHILSDLRELCRAREFVHSLCAHLPGAGLDESGVGALKLAVNEAASNIMKHAYRGRTDQWIDLEGEVFSSRVVIRLHYLGEPFELASAPLPAFDGSRESGFGVYLITQSVDEVYSYRDERGKNCMAFVKMFTV